MQAKSLLEFLLKLIKGLGGHKDSPKIFISPGTAEIIFSPTYIYFYYLCHCIQFYWRFSDAKIIKKCENMNFSVRKFV